MDPLPLPTATIRTQVSVPLRFTDGYATTARVFSFDGLAEPGTDLSAAWRERLQREGKLGPSGGSIRDLVMGSTDTH